MTTHQPASVRVVTDRQDPDSVERLLRALPDWFGIEESVHEYVADAALKPTYLAEDARTGEVLGALLVTRHWPETAEIHLLAVDPAHHRKGIGGALRSGSRPTCGPTGSGCWRSRPRDRPCRTRTMRRPGESMRDGLPAAGGVARVLAYAVPCLILVKPLCA